MGIPKKQIERHVDAVLAAMAILDCFLTKPVLGVQEIMKATGFTRNRVIRLTGTLLCHGSLMLSEKQGRFTIGPKCHALGKVFDQSNSLIALVRPVLKRLVLSTGESASLFIREGLERFVLAREEGTQSIRYTVKEGQRMDLIFGSSSKVIVAFSPPEVLAALLKTAPFDEPKPQSLKKRSDFMREIEKVRKQGYAISVGERVADAFGISVPVFNGEDELIGALAIGGPVSRLTAENRQYQLNCIREEAIKLSKIRGWKGCDFDR